MSEWKVRRDGDFLILEAHTERGPIPLAGMHIDTGEFALGLPIDDDDEAFAKGKLSEERANILAEKLKGAGK